MTLKEGEILPYQTEIPSRMCMFPYKMVYLLKVFVDNYVSFPELSVTVANKINGNMTPLKKEMFK